MKKNNCYLASNGEEGLINHRPLPCFRKCCTTRDYWDDEYVPLNCELAEYTGDWKWFGLDDQFIIIHE